MGKAIIVIFMGTIGAIGLYFGDQQPSSAQSSAPPTRSEIMDHVYFCADGDIQGVVIADGDGWIVRCAGKKFRLTPFTGVGDPRRSPPKKWNVKVLD
jgi:hypothetical protein